MKKLFILFIFISVLGVSAFAQENKCVQGGWVEDNDPKGTNIRDTPRVKGKIIGNVPVAKDQGEPNMITIIGYSNGWLKISDAETVEGKMLFEGIGWISAKKVSAAVETETGKPASLYAQPSRSSKKVGKIPSETLINIVGFDCFGYKVAYKGKTGWLSAEDYCGNPVTTCP